MSQGQIESTKILLVDDIPANLNVLRQMLEAAGYDLLCATEGETALKVAARTIPELVLLDIIMPLMDGFEVCRQLKRNESTKDIPVIFITAKHETEGVVEGFRAGGVD